MDTYWKHTRRVVPTVLAVMLGAGLGTATHAAAQEDHSHMDMSMPMNTTPGWTFMQDGVLFAEFNHQGGPRGGDQFVVPNWWMGMAARETSHGRLTFTGMLSLDPATVGRQGYRELFQAGEALDGQPIVDRQHPHDLFMQLGAAWRVPLNAGTDLTLSGGPVGEPALGPVAFMHRASATDNPTAPLSHHTFDSTHIAFGVVTAAIDHGPWTVEASVFNGREPDDNRWNFDLGRLDSVSGRVWFKPTAHWAFQASTGHLASPEQLEPGNIERTTLSASWSRSTGANVDAVTAGYGRNDTDHGARNAVFVEGARHAGLNTLYGRFETLQTEAVDGAVATLTIGAVRDLRQIHEMRGGFDGGFGADVTFYDVPASAQPAYGGHPVSFHVFFRLRRARGA